MSPKDPVTGDHRVWQPEVDTIFPETDLLIIVSWSGLATDNPSVHHCVSELPEPSLVSWVPSNNNVFTLPRQVSLDMTEEDEWIDEDEVMEDEAEDDGFSDDDGGHDDGHDGGFDGFGGGGDGHL